MQPCCLLSCGHLQLARPSQEDVLAGHKSGMSSRFNVKVRASKVVIVIKSKRTDAHIMSRHASASNNIAQYS